MSESADSIAHTEVNHLGQAVGVALPAWRPCVFPAAEVLSERVRRPTGIEVARMRVPIGVIGIIYESRPNVTADAAGLCLKSGNACILRGGSEALRSNRAIADCVQAGLRAAGLHIQVRHRLVDWDADGDAKPDYINNDTFEVTAQHLQGIYDGQDGAWRQGLVGAWLLLAAFLVMRRVRKLRREGALKP